MRHVFISYIDLEVNVPPNENPNSSIKILLIIILEVGMNPLLIECINTKTFFLPKENAELKTLFPLVDIPNLVKLTSGELTFTNGNLIEMFSLLKGILIEGPTQLVSVAT